MSRLPFPLLLTTLLLSTTQAVTLRLYPNFAEIRQDLLIKNRAFDLNFTQAQLGNIVDGSLYLSGPRVLSQLQTQQNGQQPLERFEGQIVGNGSM